MTTQPPWLEARSHSFPRLDRDLDVDVLVIGGGIAGVTAAYLVKQAGKSVALVERDRIGAGETGHTTAHISYPTDMRLTDLARKFGLDHAQAAWDANSAGAEQIAANVLAESIKCELGCVPGYLFAAPDAPADEADKLSREAALAAGMGFDAVYMQSVPISERPGIRFANLLKFHPQKYLQALAACIPGKGGHVFEESNVTEFLDKPQRVTCNGRTIGYGEVFVATHVPLQGLAGTLSATMFQTKIAAYSTYAMGVKAPRGSLPEALLWDTADPYLYLRVDRQDDCDYVIIGGADHKTGQEAHPESCYAALELMIERYAPGAIVDRRWSGQVIETLDGLPYIGEIREHQFIATGFTGTGMTFGTLAGMMFRDHVLGITNPWKDLLGVERKKLSATWDYLKENKDYAYYMIKDMFMASGDETLSSVPAGEGRLMRCKGKKVAVYRDEKGMITKLSPVCPHMGCIVHWNSSEKTWDCPCHGSRFTAKGALMAGPAEDSLHTC